MAGEKPYSVFASIYDRIMCGVDYEGWADYVEAIFKRYRHRPRSLLDLACGTGSSTIPFALRGYRIAGVDISDAMLEEARRKARRSGLKIDYYLSDLRSFKMTGPFDAALLFQDGFNYLLSIEELASAFASVRRNLARRGLFVFDLTRPALRADDGGSVCWADDRDFTLIWESSFDAAEGIWEVALTGFYRRRGGSYSKFQEKHLEKEHPPGLVEKLLQEAGFALRGIFPSFSLEPAVGNEAKLTFVAEVIDEPGPG